MIGWDRHLPYKPLMATPITATDARALSLRTGRPGPEPTWTPLQPNPGTYAALEGFVPGTTRLDPFPTPYTYSVRVCGSWGCKTFQTRAPMVTMQRAMRTAGVTSASIIKHSLMSPLTLPGQSGWETCRAQRGPDGRWLVEFCGT